MNLEIDCNAGDVVLLAFCVLIADKHVSKLYRPISGLSSEFGIKHFCASVLPIPVLNCPHQFTKVEKKKVHQRRSTNL